MREGKREEREGDREREVDGKRERDRGRVCESERECVIEREIDSFIIFNFSFLNNNSNKEILSSLLLEATQS